MDSSKSQDPHPNSDSVPSGSTTESTPPMGNNPPELPLDGGGSVSNKRKRSSSDGEPENDDSYVDIMGVSTSSKQQTESSSSKEYEVGSGRTTGDHPWNNEDINLLVDVKDFYDKHGRYPFLEGNDQIEFYENWVRGRGVFADYVQVSRKLDKLSSRFFINMEKKSNGEDVEGAMNPTEAGIFQLSSVIWGKEVPKDSSDFKVTGQNSSSKDPNESSEQETGDDQSDTKETEEEDMDVEMTDSTNSTKLQTESSTGKDKEVVHETSSSREGKTEEIGLLTDLYTLHNKTGRYVFSGMNSQRDFYKFWIEEEGEYANKEELDTKINELHARFLKNMGKNVEGPTDPVDAEILRLSHWIWGNEIDSGEGTHDDQSDTKDSATKDPKDSSKQETGGDQSDPKDSTAPSSKAN